MDIYTLEFDQGSFFLVLSFFLLAVGLWLKIREKATVLKRKIAARSTETGLFQNNEMVKPRDKNSGAKARVYREKHFKAPKGYWPLGEPR